MIIMNQNNNTKARNRIVITKLNNYDDRDDYNE